MSLICLYQWSCLGKILRLILLLVPLLWMVQLNPGVAETEYPQTSRTYALTFVNTPTLHKAPEKMDWRYSNLQEHRNKLSPRQLERFHNTVPPEFRIRQWLQPWLETEPRAWPRKVIPTKDFVPFY